MAVSSTFPRDDRAEKGSGRAVWDGMGEADSMDQGLGILAKRSVMV